MINISITDLNNPPAALSVSAPAGTRTGNILTHTSYDQGPQGLRITCPYNADITFEVGDTIQCSVDLTVMPYSSYHSMQFGVWARGMRDANTDEPGNLKWRVLEGIGTQEAIGTDANNPQKTASLGTIIVEVEFTQVCHGFFIEFLGISSGGSMAYGWINGSFTFKYLYTNTPPAAYTQGGTSATGGGWGTYNGTTAEVDFPAAPTLGALDSGFVKVFNPSAANLTALAAYLWGTFDIDSFKSIYNNPIDCIVSLCVLPVAPTVTTAAVISLGNVASDVSAPVVTDQYVVLDCGTLDIMEFWGAYLDYDPYTKCEIYLPYIGVRDIDINDVMNRKVHLKYYIDIISGACVAIMKCDNDVLYHWSGECAAEVPITSTGFGSAFQTALSAGNAIGETIVNAIGSIPQSLGQVASSVFNGARSKVHKSGSIGSTAGHMSVQKPYIIFTRPRQCLAEDQNTFTGYPSFITAQLKDLTGYTEIEMIHLENMAAISAEKDELEQLLKGGVIL